LAQPFQYACTCCRRRPPTSSSSSSGSRNQIIVNSRNDNGDACSIIDYDGVTLGPLIRKVTPYMTKLDEPGQWQVIGDRLNPGSHDDTPPAEE
jgi:hypothetical protein